MADSFFKDSRLIIYACLAVAPVTAFLEYDLTPLWYAIPAAIAIFVCEKNLVDKNAVTMAKPANIGNIPSFAPIESEVYTSIRDPISGEIRIDKTIPPPRQYDGFERR